MFSRLLWSSLAVMVALSLSGCARGSLMMVDVAANFDRLENQLKQPAAGNGMEDTYAALQGTVITKDFTVVGGYTDSPEMETFGNMMQLQLLPALFEFSRQDGGASAEIKGNTLVMGGKKSRVKVDFVKSGDIFLIKRITDK